MNTRLLTLAALSLFFVNDADAAPMTLVKNLNPNVYGIYVDGKEWNGQFDTLFFKAKATSGTFINQSNGNQSGAPRPEGHSFTYPNNMLTADPGDFPGGLGLTRIGLVNTPQELSYAIGNLGGVITTAGSPGGLFLGNLNLSSTAGFTFQVQLLRAGNILYDSQNVFPEPSSLSVAAIGGLLGLLATRRRRVA